MADLALAAARIVAGSDHWPGRSPYEGISLVPGGYGLLLRAGQAPQLVDITAITPVEDLQSGAGQFGSALTQAVQYRVSAAGATVGADLSGGLDSSAAVVLASRAGQVHAVTYTDGYTSPEDASFAARIAEHTDIEHTIAHGTDEDLPFSFPVGQPTGLEPAMGAALFEMDRTYLTPVAGLPLHLTGHGGDVVLDATSAVWVRLLQGGERRAAHRQVVTYARLRNMAPGPFWKGLRDTAALGRAGVLEKAVKQLEKNQPEATTGMTGWSWCRMGPAASWLTADGRAQVAALLRQAAADTTQPEGADEFDQWAALRFTGAAGRGWAPYADALGVRPVYPYLDNTVVRAAFAVPPLARRGHYTFKPLLSSALPDLPDWLLGRRSKGSFTPPAGHGLPAAPRPAGRSPHRQPSGHDRPVRPRGRDRHSRPPGAGPHPDRIGGHAPDADGLLVAHRHLLSRRGVMLTPANHIHYATDEHGIVLLDVRTAKWSMLSRDVSRIWQAIVTNGTADGLADELAIPTGRDPYAVRQGIDNLVNQWKRDGLLVDPTRAPRRRRWKR
ncbi:asparagine synthase-related protein [Streptomyces sp. NPDC000961]|uniref:asparagine synthase-related protein n=1 Tax=Streptomyces sp. NPDC000961 TaxID=3364541 RepID=UPI0036B96FF8